MKNKRKKETITKIFIKRNAEKNSRSKYTVITVNSAINASKQVAQTCQS